MATQHLRARFLLVLAAGTVAAAAVAVMPAMAGPDGGGSAGAAPLTTVITLTLPDTSTTASTSTSTASAPGLSFLSIFPQCSGGFLQGLTVLFGQFPAPPSAPVSPQALAALQTTGTGNQRPAVLASPQQVTSNQVFLPVLIPSAPSGSGVLILGNPSDLTSLLTLLAGGGSPPSFPGQLQGFSFNCALPTLPPPPSLPGPGSGMAAPGGGATPNGAVGETAVPTMPFATGQPVSYLGYAPTGSRSASSPVGLLPLVAVGAGLLAAGSALTAHRVRARANRSNG